MTTTPQRAVRTWIRWGLTVVGSLSLVACPTVEPIKPSLGAVLPAPATPGATVSAYGVLPTQATVVLHGQTLPHLLIPGGLQFALPRDLEAGQVPFEIRGEQGTLNGIVVVHPRVDSVAIQGRALTIVGAGWTPSSATTLQFDGLNVPTTVTAQHIVGEIPAAYPYGHFALRVGVNGYTSQNVDVKREAGAIAGSVELPAQPGPQRASVAALARNGPERTLIVPSTVLLPPLLGLTTTQLNSSLPWERLEFDTPEHASRAIEHLQSLGIAAQFSTRIATQSQGTGQTAQAPKATSNTSTNAISDTQWHLNLTQIRNAWTRTKGAGITVAIVDTGIDLGHPDLKGNILPGYDFVEHDTTPQDTVGHGTHVAGLVAANGAAMGVAPEAKLLAVRVLPNLQNGDELTVAEGILWAADLLPQHPNPNKANVINLSLGSAQLSVPIAQAVQRALEANVVVVAAAGNDGGRLNYPAALPGVIAVTALAGPEIAYQPWYASHGVGTWLAAYGGDRSQDQNHDNTPDGIASTDLTATGYGLRDGTSMAAPQVAGLAALTLANGTPVKMVRQLLAATATDLGVMGQDLNYGHGLMSGRATTTFNTPRLYAVALNTKREVVGFAPVQHDGTFLIGNLEPNQTLKVVVASDTNNNGICGESDDLSSIDVYFEVFGATVTKLMPVILELNLGRDIIECRSP